MKYTKNVELKFGDYRGRMKSTEIDRNNPINDRTLKPRSAQVPR